MLEPSSPGVQSFLYNDRAEDSCLKSGGPRDKNLFQTRHFTAFVLSFPRNQVGQTNSDTQLTTVL